MSPLEAFDRAVERAERRHQAGAEEEIANCRSVIEKFEQQLDEQFGELSMPDYEPPEFDQAAYSHALDAEQKRVETALQLPQENETGT